jgi:gamma-glutamylcyclotransferase (GGCT)/AIG2-like uncharacterized protein YtfP
MVARATIRGTLLDLGDYPGVLLDNPLTQVPGTLFALPQPSGQTWAQLDAYEGYREDDPPGSLFVRHRTLATIADGATVECWVYLYNGVSNIALNRLS